MARSLRGYPVECWGTAVNLENACCLSRFWAHIEGMGGGDGEQISSLLSLAKRAISASGQLPLLLFSQDEWVIRGSENREVLCEYVRMVIPEHQNLMNLMDKTLFHDWAAAGDYPLPLSKIVDNSDDLYRVVGSFAPPFVVKPLVRTAKWDAVYRNTKVISCENEEDGRDLLNLADTLFDLSPRYVVQEWIAGDDGDVVFCLLCADETGKILDAFTGRKLWQWPPLTGSTAICTSFEGSGIEAVSRALMTDARLRGLGSVEFKYNRNDGRYLITEPTVGRNNYQSYIAVCAGHNLVGRLVESVFDLPVMLKRKPRQSIWVDEISALRRARVEKRGFLKLLMWMLRYSLASKCFLLTDRSDLLPARRRIRELL